ncbi:dienelactone hydrolase family protein [Rossellomorea vietnamensis]|uniref:dienelactone hydrolase family protein n=1 Tax=Rossellomorea vietnamensis TaxID=218284 RepID=UPI00068A97E2|nr:CocE/NonD family hydrolase [Rossellomorea vietnamensis]
MSKRKSFRWVVIALVLCLISAIGASFVQTSGGKVTVKDLRWETPSGHMMSALLYVPDDVSKDNPAPGIVTSHGWYNTREMQDLNYVELARRGYVVISIDMYGHGNSDAVKPEEWMNRGTGMYDAVELMADLPYVDKEKIGVTGHSNGARAANWSINEDNKKDEPLISSVLLIANDAMYTSDPAEPLYWSMQPKDREYVNVYGSRDVGIVAAQYDEFFFRSLKEDGTATVPRDFIDTEPAQSFLNFGIDPTGGEKRKSYEIYKQEVDGQEAARVIYNPAQIHPWNHISKDVVTSTLEFFEDSLGAPHPIAANNQVWQYKVFFNAVGLVGFVIFIVSITKWLLFTETFASLRAVKEAEPMTFRDGRGKLWFWGGLIAGALVSYFSYLKLSTWTVEHITPFFPQYPPFYIGMWCLVTGLFTLMVVGACYFFYSKKNGMDLRVSGVVISFRTLVKTIGLALCVTVLSYSLVFIADYFFKTDFRLWVLTVKTFTPDKLLIALKYLPFFLVFYVANSIAINSFNFIKLGQKEWMNTAVLTLFNSLAIIILVAIQYIAFFVTGEVYYNDLSHIIGIWLFPIIVILMVAAIVSRKIYKVTGNPYLAGFINAFIITIMTVTNTLTQL